MLTPPPRKLSSKHPALLGLWKLFGPQPDKSLLRLWKKFYYRDIQEYTDICFPSASRMLFLDV